MTFPSSISTEDLDKLYKEAACEEEQVCTCNNPDGEDIDGLTPGELIDLVDELNMKLVERCSSPMASKVMAMRCLKDLGTFHFTMGMDISEDDAETAAEWFSDEGCIHSAWKLLKGVNMGPTDFICVSSEEDN